MMINTKLNELISSIAKRHGVSPAFVKPSEELDPILEKLGSPIPDDLRQYLDNSLMRQSLVAGSTVIHSADWVVLENRDYVPGADMVEHGMLCLAKASDGSQFAYSISDSAIYWIDCEDYLQPEAVKEQGPWRDSLKAFLSELLHDVSD